MRIPLSRPAISESDIAAVVAVLRTPQLSLGPKLVEFEEAVARYIETEQGIAVSSGTAGLHIGLLALGIREGDEVILPSFTFIAAANAVRHVRATPVFADIDPGSLNITAESIERVITPRTRAILLVHTFGYPADLPPILALAVRHNLRVIEDACEALGAEYGGRRIGGFGDLGVFSFYPNKPITMGEGGVVVTRDAGLARTMRALRNQGRLETDGWLQHSLLGYNYRLSDISCALGISQLAQLEPILAQRERVANWYYEFFEGCNAVELPTKTVADGRVSWFAFVVRIAQGYRVGTRERLAASLTAAGIGCRAYFPPVHLQPLYSEYFRVDQPLPVTDGVASRTLALPFFNSLERDQVEEVCSRVRATLEEFRRST